VTKILQAWATTPPLTPYHLSQTDRARHRGKHAQKQWQSPYYWAAFTMQGEWR
jgi:CHAT domain-containing protein